MYFISPLRSRKKLREWGFSCAKAPDDNFVFGVLFRPELSDYGLDPIGDDMRGLCISTTDDQGRVLSVVVPLPADKVRSFVNAHPEFHLSIFPKLKREFGVRCDSGARRSAPAGTVFDTTGVTSTSNLTAIDAYRASAALQVNPETFVPLPEPLRDDLHGLAKGHPMRRLELTRAVDANAQFSEFPYREYLVHHATWDELSLLGGSSVMGGATGVRLTKRDRILDFHMYKIFITKDPRRYRYVNDATLRHEWCLQIGIGGEHACNSY